MLEFIILNTNVVELNYSYIQESNNGKIDIEMGTSTRILRNNSNPKMVVIETLVDAISPNTNLKFKIKTMSFIELKIDMSEAEINNKCLPLIFMAVNERVKSITGCLNAPYLELPPAQQLVENMLCAPKK